MQIQLYPLTVQVLPELQARPDQKEILQADALKYVTTFRSQLSKEDLIGALAHLSDLLGSESNVVHSYAAILLERLLASRVGSHSLAFEFCASRILEDERFAVL